MSVKYPVRTAPPDWTRGQLRHGFLKPLTKAEGEDGQEEHIFLAVSAVSFSLCSPAARVVFEILEGRSLSRQFRSSLLPCPLMNLSNPFTTGDVCLRSSLWYQITGSPHAMKRNAFFFMSKLEFPPVAVSAFKYC